jgi:ABC-type transport system involved in cytochrome bd biosynthesis fused ATPase/permease subunit
VAGAGSRRPDAAGGLMRVLLAAIVACIVLAVVVALVTTSDFGTAVAITLGGTAFVLVISAAFYAVGRSEDRERAREAEKR